ncbi:hypothetical protein [Streptomyces sp. MZ04]|uniref:hypothetical protein n=1 Tax=Streptomyces sp. MZ04 TaxID=2559236 RepID=UPI00107E9A75|nr:hypothetical protein [Streptomyces sp. MZ04]TGB13261.1 hypothetical protein E2651_10040 [Streptomyces sp. MZ04]
MEHQFPYVDEQFIDTDTTDTTDTTYTTDTTDTLMGCARCFRERERERPVAVVAAVCDRE